MKAIIVDPVTHNLSWESVPDPQCTAKEVVVDIHATAVNRADLLQRSGKYPPPPGAPKYLGLEMAGVVSETTKESIWHPGDRVCALLSGGGYAERVAVDERMLHRIPDHWEFTYAGSIPEVFYTAFLNLFMEAGLGNSETVLIHGGASGVGTAAIQLAVQSGCRVLATAGSGDVLTGILASVTSQGLDINEAAVYSTYLHSECAHQYRKNINELGLNANDLIEMLPYAQEKLRYVS